MLQTTNLYYVNPNVVSPGSRREIIIVKGCVPGKESYLFWSYPTWLSTAEKCEQFTEGCGHKRNPYWEMDKGKCEGSLKVATAGMKNLALRNPWGLVLWRTETVIDLVWKMMIHKQLLCQGNII